MAKKKAPAPELPPERPNVREATAAPLSGGSYDHEGQELEAPTAPAKGNTVEEDEE